MIRTGRTLKKMMFGNNLFLHILLDVQSSFEFEAGYHRKYEGQNRQIKKPPLF